MKNGKVAAILVRLRKMADELEAGQHFDITRLTSIKSLCTDPRTANAFVLHLARLATRKSWDSSQPKGEEKRLLKLARKSLANYKERPRRIGVLHPLGDLHSQLRAYQDEYRHIPFGVVRQIKSMRLLIWEKATDCIMSPEAAPYWAYQVARDFADRYTPGQPSGLTRNSAPFVRQIIKFWENYDPNLKPKPRRPMPWQCEDQPFDKSR